MNSFKCLLGFKEHFFAFSQEGPREFRCYFSIFSLALSTVLYFSPWEEIPCCITLGIPDVSIYTRLIADTQTPFLASDEMSCWPHSVLYQDLFHFQNFKSQHSPSHLILDLKKLPQELREGLKSHTWLTDFDSMTDDAVTTQTSQCGKWINCNTLYTQRSSPLRIRTSAEKSVSGWTGSDRSWPFLRACLFFCRKLGWDGNMITGKF